MKSVLLLTIEGIILPRTLEGLKQNLLLKASRTAVVANSIISEEDFHVRFENQWLIGS